MSRTNAGHSGLTAPQVRTARRWPGAPCRSRVRPERAHSGCGCAKKCGIGCRSGFESSGGGPASECVTGQTASALPDRSSAGAPRAVRQERWQVPSTFLYTPTTVWHRET